MREGAHRGSDLGNCNKLRKSFHKRIKEKLSLEPRKTRNKIEIFHEVAFPLSLFGR